MKEIDESVHEDRVGDTEREASSAPTGHGSTGLLDEFLHAAEEALSLPEPAASRWHRGGVSSGVDRWFNLGGGIVVLLLAIGWIWTFVLAASGEAGPSGARGVPSLAGSLTNRAAPNAAYVTDAALNVLSGGLRGASGKLRATLRPTGAPIGEDFVLDQPSGTGGSAPAKPGIWRLAVAVGSALKPVTDMNLITVRSRAEKQNGRLGLYYIGSWRGERGEAVGAPRAAPADRYRPPSGFIEVTPENADTKVSEHFTLRNFLTKNQPNVWPKYLVLELRNIDKLELILADLKKQGIDVSGVRVLSGFRTPQYNSGGGNTRGRAGLSRHMYGDAADIFIDSNNDGVMDDLNRDGRSTIADSRVISAAADRVEAAHPDLVGGVGVYPGAAGHGPFVHIDTRGYRARWLGGPGGG